MKNKGFSQLLFGFLFAGGLLTLSYISNEVRVIPPEEMREAKAGDTLIVQSVKGNAYDLGFTGKNR